MHAYFPRPPLGDFVELFWLYESLALPHAQERLMPSGTFELVINLRENESIFVGAHSESHLIDTSRERTILGVHFRPGGAFPFLGGVPGPSGRAPGSSAACPRTNCTTASSLSRKSGASPVRANYASVSSAR